MNNTDICWKQRFKHFNNAFSFFKSAIAIEQPTVIDRAGLIQFFKWLNLHLWAQGYIRYRTNLADLKNKQKPLSYFFEVINY